MLPRDRSESVIFISWYQVGCRGTPSRLFKFQLQQMKTFVLILFLFYITISFINAQLVPVESIGASEQAFGVGVASSSQPLASQVTVVTTSISSFVTTETIVLTSISQPTGTQSALPQSNVGGLNMGSIIGLSVAGGVAVIGLIIAFFICKLKRKRRFSDFDRNGITTSEMSNTVPSPGVVNPFIVLPSTLLRQNDTSNGQSLHSQSIPSKFSHGNQPSESTSSNGGIPPLTPLRRQFSSSFITSSSSPPSRLPLSESQVNLDRTSPKVPQATTEPSIPQRSPSPQGAIAGFAGFVRHEDSGVRIPLAGNNFVELPPHYSPG